MKIRITLIGSSPVLLHNPRLVDPDFEITREIKSLASKRKKTDDDLEQISRLEWLGGLYEEGGKIVQPTSKVRKCLVNTAKMSKLGKAVERTISFGSLNVPLIFPDSDLPIKDLMAKPQYHSRLSVGIGQKRVMRTRPSFFPWSLVVDGIFVEDAGLNFDDLQRIVELAGTVEGIGDNRVNGYGRFAGEVKKI